MAGLLYYIQNKFPYRPPADNSAAPLQGRDQRHAIAEQHGGQVPLSDAMSGEDIQWFYDQGYLDPNVRKDPSHGGWTTGALQSEFQARDVMEDQLGGQIHNILNAGKWGRWPAWHREKHSWGDPYMDMEPSYDVTDIVGGISDYNQGNPNALPPSRYGVDQVMSAQDEALMQGQAGGWMPWSLHQQMDENLQNTIDQGGNPGGFTPQYWQQELDRSRGY